MKLHTRISGLRALAHHVSDVFYGRSIFTQILTALVATALPLLMLVLAAVYYLSSTSAETQRVALQYSATSMASALDNRLAKYIALADSLARSPAALRDDLTEFRQEAVRTIAVAPHAWVLVADLAGQQLMNTATDATAPLPPRAPIGLDDQKLAMQLQKTVVSGVRIGPLVNDWIVSVETPVLRDGKPVRALAVVVTARSFIELFNVQKLPKDMLIGIADRTGRFVTRYPGGDPYMGQLASSGWRAQMGHDGVTEMTSVDDVKIFNANATSTISGWNVGVATTKASLNAEVWGTMWIAVVLGALICLLSAVLSIAVAHRISSPIAQLSANAANLLADPDLPLERGPRELITLQEALRSAASDRKLYENQLLLLNREIAHRGKNQLAVVQAIARQSANANTGAFLNSFDQRIRALGSAHDLLTHVDWQGVQLDKLVGEQIALFEDPVSDKVHFEGPSFLLNSHAVQALGLALHELATNSLKYGALSSENGSIRIAWSTTRERFSMSWIERGGPVTTQPAIMGFGTTVITGMIEMALGGKVELGYLPSGVEWRLDSPLENMRAQPAATKAVS